MTAVYHTYAPMSQGAVFSIGARMCPGVSSIDRNVPANTGEVALLVQHARRCEGRRRRYAGMLNVVAVRRQANVSIHLRQGANSNRAMWSLFPGISWFREPTSSIRRMEPQVLASYLC